MHFRSNAMNEARSRIFLGKNKLLQIALGRTPEDEFSDNLRHVSKRIKGGSIGLLFTSSPQSEVEDYFSNLVETGFCEGRIFIPKGCLCIQ